MMPLTPIYQFLGCKTPEAWVKHALEQLPLLLVDHAHCEKKAATTALGLISRYPDKTRLLDKMSRLAREELSHFNKVIKILRGRGLAYTHLTSGRYAKSMHAHIQQQEPQRLIDQLIIGALIEARSCERFAALVPHLDAELAHFYQSLLQSEARHFQDYLDLAGSYAPSPIEGRIAYFIEMEKNLVQTPDPCFRFHSGVPAE